MEIDRKAKANLMGRLLKHTTVDPEKALGCVEWKGAKSEWGYGRIGLTIDGKFRTIYVSAASWLVFRGPIPEGKCVCHSCDNPACYNPNHLFLGSHSKNMQDSYEKGRSVYRPPVFKDPEKNDEVLALWLYYGQTRLQIAATLGLTNAHVCYCLKRARKYGWIDKRARGSLAHKLPEILSNP